MELRTFTYIDVLQPQLTGFLQTVSQGFMPLEGQAALFIEIAPGIAINQLTDVALKATSVQPGMPTGCSRCTTSTRARCAPPARRSSTG